MQFSLTMMFLLLGTGFSAVIPVGQSVGGWQSGMKYEAIDAKVGDVLVFNFNINHNVFLVDNDQCDFSSAVELAGNTASPYVHSLTKAGVYHFVCATGGHCQSGQNLQVTVTGDAKTEAPFDPTQLCLPRRCDPSSLMLPNAPGQLGESFTPLYDQACMDTLSKECANFINNLQACAKEDRWDSSMEDVASIFAPYIGSFARAYMTNVLRGRDMARPREESAGRMECPYLEVMYHVEGVSPAGGNSEDECVEFCATQSTPLNDMDARAGPCGAGFELAVPAKTGSWKVVNDITLQTSILVRGKGGDDLNPNCDAGNIQAHIEGENMFGGADGECTVLCTLEMAINFLPGAKMGPCSGKYSELVRAETVQPAGSPMPVAVVILKGKAGGDHNPECSAGNIHAHIEGKNMFGGADGECTLFCTMEFALNFVPGAKKGLCANKYSQLVRKEMVQPEGSPMSMDVVILMKAGGRACDESPVHAIGIMGSSGVECSEYCLPQRLFTSIPGAIEGSCAQAGFPEMVKEETVQPQGFDEPIPVGRWTTALKEEVDLETKLKEGWCETKFGQGSEGRDVITCYGGTIMMFPGQVIDSVFSLPNPFKEQMAIYRRGAWMVDANLEEVPLSEMYVHHMGSAIVGGVGAEFRGWTEPFPGEHRLLMDRNVPGFANLHLINTLGVEEDNVLPCVECWCERPEGTLETTNFGDLGGVSCCYNCSTTLPLEPRSYRLMYAFEVEPVTSATIPMAQIWMDIIPGKIEYDVPKALPGEEPVHVIEHVTRIDYSAPQTHDMQIVRCAAHLHIAALGMWMYDAVTGEEICSVGVKYGEGPRTELMNEKGYLVAIEPTTYDPPKVLPPGHPVRLVAKYDSKEFHGGVMALMWLDVAAHADFRGQGNNFFVGSAESFAPPACPSMEPPSFVRDLHVVRTDAASGTVTLMWSEPASDFDCQKDLYSVEMVKASEEPRFELAATFTDRSFFGSDTSVTLTDLDSREEYILRVTAYKARAVKTTTLPEQGQDGVGAFKDIRVRFDMGFGSVPKCVDTKPHLPWNDDGGAKFTCEWYGGGPAGRRCSKDGGKHANSGMTANQACCACGGGSKGSNGYCADNTMPAIWHDSESEEHTCEYYAQQGLCQERGASFAFIGLVANDACCACRESGVETSRVMP